MLEDALKRDSTDELNPRLTFALVRALRIVEAGVKHAKRQLLDPQLVGQLPADLADLFSSGLSRVDAEKILYHWRNIDRQIGHMARILAKYVQAPVAPESPPEPGGGQ